MIAELDIELSHTTVSTLSRELDELITEFRTSKLRRYYPSGTAGTLIPLGLHRLGIDPALASSIFLTTTTDVFGFFIFLFLAQTFLL
ncbi:MAG: magnesium transporter [Campylobacterales bacterium]|nr:magnesium transporter [Campylobacterales bacterium]